MDDISYLLPTARPALERPLSVFEGRVLDQYGLGYHVHTDRCLLYLCRCAIPYMMNIDRTV